MKTNDPYCFSRSLFPFYLLCICSLLSLSSIAQSYGGIRFYNGNWFEVLNKAQEEGKFIFVDAYADYCRPCKEMDKSVFTNQEVALLYNKNFINYKLDVEDVTNHQFKEKYGVKQLPTFLYFTSSGELVKKDFGAKSVFDFLLLGKQVVDDVSNAFLPNSPSSSYGDPINPMNPTQVAHNPYEATMPNYSAPPLKKTNPYEEKTPAFPTTKPASNYAPPTTNTPSSPYQYAATTSPQMSNPTPIPESPFNTVQQTTTTSIPDYPMPQPQKDSQPSYATNPLPTYSPNQSANLPEMQYTSQPTYQSNNTSDNQETESLVKNYSPHTKEAAYQELQQLKNLYDSGNRHPQLLKQYSYLLKRHYQPYNLVVNEYLSTQQQRMDITDNLQFIYDFSINLENDAINLFLYNLSYFKTQYSGKVINEKVQNAVYQSIITAIRGRYHQLFEKAMQVIHQAKLPNEDQFIFEVQSFYYQGINDWERYAEIATDYLTRKEISDPRLLNNVGEYFYNFVHDKKMLKRAIKWVEQSIRIESEHYNHHTLAMLYYKLKNFKQARRVAEKAVQIAQLRNEEDKATRQLLDNLRKM